MNFDVSLKLSQQDRERERRRHSVTNPRVTSTHKDPLFKSHSVEGEENIEEEMYEDTVRWTESEAGMAKRSWEMEKKRQVGVTDS